MKRIFGAVIIAFILSLGPMYKAAAQMCCDPWGGVGYAAFVQAGTVVVTSITTSVTTLVNVIELQLSPSWSNGFAKQMGEMQKQTAANKIYKQGELAVQSQLHMQETAAEAAERAVTPAQQNVTLSSALMLSEQRNVVREKVAAADQAFAAEVYSATVKDSGTVIARHEPYCSSSDKARGRCEALASSTMQNADLTVNTIFAPGDGQYETLTDEERNAANAFVRNVVNPVPLQHLPAALAKSEQAKAVDAELLADQAALSVAAHSFNAAIAHRTRRHQQ